MGWARDWRRAGLLDFDLEPQYLEIELTETTVMDNAEGSVAILEQLSRMGVVVSIDDFGTGYSSMSYRRRFPIDKLKIDRSFRGISPIEHRRANHPEDFEFTATQSRLVAFKAS